jgi:hypothetical protein
MLRNENLNVNSAETNTTTEDKNLDKKAMDGAKRAENRLRDNEDKTPGDQIFTK